MAGDWIKIRVHIDRDPKVRRMADYLAADRAFMDWLTDPVRKTCKESAYEHVTSNVTVALCVTALGVTWGVAREQGRRINDDLVVDCCDEQTVSDIAGVPGFGQAMADVEWLVVDPDTQVATFPNFFRDNESPHDRHRKANAERQARFRSRHSEPGAVNSCPDSNVTNNVTRNVTVTHREEKRREENKKPPTPLPDSFDSLLTNLDVRAFDTPAMRDAWGSWAADRRERGKRLTARAVKMQAKKIAEWGPARTIAAIEHSISGGYQGLFEPNGKTRAAQSDSTRVRRNDYSDVHVEEFHCGG